MRAQSGSAQAVRLTGSCQRMFREAQALSLQRMRSISVLLFLVTLSICWADNTLDSVIQEYIYARNKLATALNELDATKCLVEHVNQSAVCMRLAFCHHGCTGNLVGLRKKLCFIENWSIS